MDIRKTFAPLVFIPANDVINVSHISTSVYNNTFDITIES